MNKLIFLFLLVFSFSLFAQICDDSGDCTEGYCYNGECVNPDIADKIIGLPCVSTYDCIEGYCIQDLGKCIIPLTGEKLINFGFKGGCTGIVVCPENNLICFILCNLIWIILLVLSILAAYFSKDLSNKLIPIFAFILPLFVALVSIPFAGIIVAVIELILITYYKKQIEEKTIPKKEEDTTDYLSPLKNKQEEY
ncbi:MAG: hypothetical protein WC356_05730 [Candidatus Micrarchaeia archaeon]|jgi:hypothetical protein